MCGPTQKRLVKKNIEIEKKSRIVINNLWLIPVMEAEPHVKKKNIEDTGSI